MFFYNSRYNIFPFLSKILTALPRARMHEFKNSRVPVQDAIHRINVNILHIFLPSSVLHDQVNLKKMTCFFYCPPSAIVSEEM